MSGPYGRGHSPPDRDALSHACRDCQITIEVSDTVPLGPTYSRLGQLRVDAGPARASIMGTSCWVNCGPEHRLVALIHARTTSMGQGVAGSGLGSPSV